MSVGGSSEAWLARTRSWPATSRAARCRWGPSSTKPYSAPSEEADTGAEGAKTATEEVAVRRLVVTMFVALDAVMEHPEKWHFRFIDEEATKRVHEDLLASDALVVVVGRETYEGYAAVWPSRAGDEHADRINALPNQVASTRLEEPFGWNNSTLIEGDVAEEVSRLKQEPGKDILMHGCGSLARELARPRRPIRDVGPPGGVGEGGRPRATLPRRRRGCLSRTRGRDHPRAGRRRPHLPT